MKTLIWVFKSAFKLKAVSDPGPSGEQAEGPRGNPSLLWVLQTLQAFLLKRKMLLDCGLAAYKQPGYNENCEQPVVSPAYSTFIHKILTFSAPRSTPDPRPFSSLIPLPAALGVLLSLLLRAEAGRGLPSFRFLLLLIQIQLLRRDLDAQLHLHSPESALDTLQVLPHCLDRLEALLAAAKVLFP